MDHDAFDLLARRVNLATRRRSLLGALGGLGLLGGASLAGPDADAKRKKKKKKKKKCVPDSRAVTCRGRCGSVQNNCRQAVQCDCPVCSRCDSGGVCVQEAVGTACGGTNSCTADGQCACDSDRCGGFEICSGGSCVVCGIIDALCCENAFCQVGAVCNFGTCLACGRSNERCCANQTCDPGRACVQETCEDCGDSGQPCCTTGNACLNGACNAGTCP